MLAALVYRRVKTQCAFKGSINSLLEKLNHIRLATLLEPSTTTGKMKAVYKLEEMTEEDQDILRALAIEDIHRQRPTIRGVGVYT